MKKKTNLKTKKLAVITGYNSASGISEYSKNFYSNIEAEFKSVTFFANKDAGDVIFKDKANVKRTWEMAESEFTETLSSLIKYNPDIVHIQFHPAEYPSDALALLVKKIDTELAETKILLTPHAVQEDGVDLTDYVNELSLADIIFLHTNDDLNFLQEKGFSNLSHFQHGIRVFADENRYQLRRRYGIKSQKIIASHGLINENKGLIEIIKSLNILRERYPDILFLSINAYNPNNASSAATLDKMLEAIADNKLENNVILITDFLELHEVMKLLHLADMFLLPYEELFEGASGAVTTCLSACRPVVLTNSHLFSEVSAGIRIEDNLPESIAAAVVKLYENEKFYDRQIKIARNFINDSSWQVMSAKYLEIVKDILF